MASNLNEMINQVLLELFTFEWNEVSSRRLKHVRVIQKQSQAISHDTWKRRKVSNNYYAKLPLKLLKMQKSIGK